ncbi:hypothetical protein QFC19_001895 [Naganishia cerealis]|uniref:Uncharacterized protein n=1 Tax=Naganishia cerealis TaxID=610337 RepID=A0ACC2WDT2_9TREE|nr:hypothetical protein QFC19_001895 [Naganishia cerealis]
MEVRGQSRPVPEEGLRGTSGTKYLDVDEIEEEITCPICMCVLDINLAQLLSGGSQQTCPICRKTLSTPISLSLVPLHVMDALVEKWVKTKGRGWDGLIEWQDRREVWEAQRVVWREDLEAIEMERERGRQESHRSPLGDSGGLPLSDFLLTDFLSLGIHDGVPLEYVGPDPISAFLDEVSRLRRDIRTGSTRTLPVTNHASVASLAVDVIAPLSGKSPPFLSIHWERHRLGIVLSISLEYRVKSTNATSILVCGSR